MKLLEYEELQKMVDYSFGDHSGVLGRVPNAFMKKANEKNYEFLNFITSTHKEKITLFIDNIRLYKRPINFCDWEHKKPLKDIDKEWLENFKDEDLLELCSKFPNKQFIIFTAFEDTPLDEYIEGRIPENVISINATNAVYVNDKINPMPHGIERIMYNGYNHHKILLQYINDSREASNLLYVNHREDTGTRTHLRELLKSWATISPKVNYEKFLEGIKTHKFVLCPSGNGIGSARNWETLYLRRVPVMERHPYKEVLFKDFPILYVDSFTDLTQKLLEDNEHLYLQALELDMTK
jgi:hypothetical protein